MCRERTTQVENSLYLNGRTHDRLGDIYTERTGFSFSDHSSVGRVGHDTRRNRLNRLQ